MKLVPVTTIQTPRLILRKVRMEDLPHYHQHLTSDPSVSEYMLWNATDDINHTEASIRRILAGYEAGTRLHWAIALTQSDILIGTIALLNFNQSDNSCGFAYMLGRDFWGKGYGTEAVKAVLKFAFEDLNIRAVIADHFEGNPASGAVMEKAGMKKSGLLTGRYEKNGAKINSVEYRIKKEDFFKNNP